MAPRRRTPADAGPIGGPLDARAAAGIAVTEFQPKPRSEQLQAALDASCALSDWLQQELHEEAKLQQGRREMISLAYANLALEHREAILLLIAAGASATAMAVVRSILESYALALWANELATDHELLAFWAGRFNPPQVDAIMRRISKKLAPHGSSFEALRRHYGVLNDYAHGGLRQVSRWIHEGEVAPLYSDGQMMEALRFCDTVGLMAAHARQRICDHPTEGLLERLAVLLNSEVGGQ